MNLRLRVLTLLLLSATLCAAQQPASTTASSTTADAAAHISTLPRGLPKITPIEHKNIVYRHASGQDQFLDVYQQPGGQLAPVVVYWHGGAWWKGQRPATWGAFRALLDMGFSVVSVDYRLTGVARAPATVEDVRCSLAWVARNATTYHFDTSRIVAYGTSAGGHLALMAGFLPDDNIIDPPDCRPVPHVAAIMDFYGIPDIKGVVTSGIPLSKSTLRWIGTGPQQLALATAMSPVTYLRPGLPPVFIAHGSTDPVVPYQQSVNLKKSLEALHVPVTLYTVPNGVHGRFPPDQMLHINEQLLTFFRANNILPPN